MSEVSEYFVSDPDWAAYAERNGINLASTPSAEPPQLDIASGRASQVVNESKWAEEHPLALVGYQSCIQQVSVRDGQAIDIKISWPLDLKSTDATLPLLFVCHGGGWIQGTHTTEEAWLLWPLMTHLKLVIVSVAYRLAPEHLFPIYINDCWDVFQAITGKTSSYSLPTQFDHQKIILAGSSAGALIAATLSQKARDCETAANACAVVLNVPVTCDYRFWPTAKVNQSYLECEAALLPSSVMRQVWDMAVPEGAGADPQASPLLGNASGLPPHFIYVAGQDPLRDEGIEYAHRLSEAGNSATLHVYPGVPHTFGEMWELKATKKFWNDVVADVKTLL